MNAFNLHDQLNVLVQKLAAGAIRKVRMAAGALLGAYAVWKQRGDTFFSFPSLQLCFVLSILGNSSVLILDEPSTGLDVSGQQQIR